MPWVDNMNTMESVLLVMLIYLICEKLFNSVNIFRRRVMYCATSHQAGGDSRGGDLGREYNI